MIEKPERIAHRESRRLQLDRSVGSSCRSSWRCPSTASSRSPAPEADRVEPPVRGLQKECPAVLSRARLGRVWCGRGRGVRGGGGPRRRRARRRWGSLSGWAPPGSVACSRTRTLASSESCCCHYWSSLSRCCVWETETFSHFEAVKRCCLECPSERERER